MLGRRPPSFKYSVRTLAVLFLPSVILLDFGGGTLQGLAALGVMLVYLLHAARLDQSCFTVLWATVLLEAIGHAGSAFYTFGFGARGLDWCSARVRHFLSGGRSSSPCRRRTAPRGLSRRSPVHTRQQLGRARRGDGRR